jgi:hypothetical protein
MTGPFLYTGEGNRYLVIAMAYCTQQLQVYADPTQEDPTVEEVRVTTAFRSWKYHDSLTLTKAGTARLALSRRCCNTCKSRTTTRCTRGRTACGAEYENRSQPTCEKCRLATDGPTIYLFAYRASTTT